MAFPATGLEMLSFLGLCNYYRKLIPHFSEWAAPLDKISRDTKIEITEDLTEPFEKLKIAACHVPVLQIPDPNRPFVLETDASGVAIGAVLKQITEEGEYHVLFYSQGLSKSERNYSPYERELYAVVKACEAFKVFLLGTSFILMSDHKALSALFNSNLKVRREL